MRIARLLSIAGTLFACKGPSSQPAPDKQPAEPAEFPLAEATIAAIDRRGPTLRSVIELNPDALADARALDRERAEKGPRGPLHGIPILLKDNVATAGPMETTAGSMALVGFRPPADAALVARLRAAGAVILGKANLSEWANFRSSRSSSGWSARGGQVRNPYVLDRSPCGSSSGSGVAVAANLVAAAIGTETDGSVVCPASANGIVGIKPTVGRVSGEGIIPIAHSQDTAGPMARTVADAALVLAAIAEEVEGQAPIDVAAALDAGALRGKRIGVARDLFGSDPDVIALMDASIAAMREAGAVIVDPIELAVPPELESAELEVLLFELKADMAGYLARLGPGAPDTLADLIAFNTANAETELVHFDQEWFVKAAERGDLESAEYKQALATSRRLARDEGIDRAIARDRLDAIVAPTGSPAWVIDQVNGDHYILGTSTLAAVAGYPNITVPAGFIAGLPVGISIFGPAWSEQRLIGIAHAFERATRARRRPQLRPTIDL
jgi:amidase